MNETNALLMELMDKYEYTPVIHKKEQWLKFYNEHQEYFMAVKLHTNLDDAAFLQKYDKIPF